MANRRLTFTLSLGPVQFFLLIIILQKKLPSQLCILQIAMIDIHNVSLFIQELF